MERSDEALDNCAIRISNMNTIRAKKILQSGGGGVMPTDTLYGFVGSALRPETVERIYQLRKRNSRKAHDRAY